MADKKRVLVIDDELSILASINRQLKNENLEVDLENNPDNALIRLENSRYDLVITDIKMTPITGLDVLQIMKEKYAGIPVIVLTGFVDDKILNQVKNIGCDDLIIKPVRKKTLVAAIRNLL